MNIFIRELKAGLKSLLIWSGIIALFSIVGFSKFTAYEGNPELLVILESIPQAMIEAFSMSAFNLTTVTGFYGVMFTYFALVVCIAAAMWGSDIISKEERDKTIEFSLTLPVKRSTMITSKSLAALINCIGLLAVTWISTIVNAASFQTDNKFYEFVALCMVALFIMQLIFLAVGIFLGSVMKQYKRASSTAVSLLLGTYILSVISGLDKDLDFLKYFTPFKYFDPAKLLNDAKIEVSFLFLSLGIVVACMAGAYVAYKRRDLYI